MTVDRDPKRLTDESLAAELFSAERHEQDRKRSLSEAQASYEAAMQRASSLKMEVLRRGLQLERDLDGWYLIKEKIHDRSR